MQEFEYTAYRHGNSNTTPYGEIYSEIYGVEFEIEEVHDFTSLNNHIHVGDIEACNTVSAPIQLEREDDNSIDYELIFNADSKETLLERIRYLLNVFSLIIQN